MDPWDNMTITLGDATDTDDNDTITIISGNDYSLSPSLSTTSITGGLSTALNGPLWTNSTITATASPYGYTYNNTPGSLKVSGNAEFEGDIKIKGVNLTERLDDIEKRLGILRPNNDLEGRWEKLKELGEEYRKLEKEILEKEQVWDLLKK